MSTHRCLLSIIRNISRCQPFGYKILRMLADNSKAFRYDIVPIFLTQMKPAAEIRLSQTLKEVGQVILHTC